MVEDGNGIVTTRTFLGSFTRVAVLLDGGISLRIDKPSTEAAALPRGPRCRSRSRPSRGMWPPGKREPGPGYRESVTP